MDFEQYRSDNRVFISSLRFNDHINRLKNGPIYQLESNTKSNMLMTLSTKIVVAELKIACDTSKGMIVINS